MLNKEALTTNASKKRGGNNKTGKGGFADNPQHRSNAGQRSREVVATAAQARALYVQVLHETSLPEPAPDSCSNLEYIVRLHVRHARSGDSAERELIFDRIWGKAVQPVGGDENAPLILKVIYDDDNRAGEQSVD